MSQYCKNLGLMGAVFRDIQSLNSVYGWDIAMDGMLKALLNHSSLAEVTFFHEPMAERELLQISELASVGKTKIKLFPEMDILQRAMHSEVDLLHNTNSEFTSLVYYREHFCKNKMPITYTIHCASYDSFIQDMYLMMLLLPFRSYDSLICTSRSVKSVVSNMLENVGENFNKEYNTNIEYKGRLDVIPLGVDIDHFKPMDKIEARRKNEIAEDAFVILWLGRFSSYDKADILPLLIVYKRLLKKNPDKKLLLVLAGHDRKNMPFMPAIENYLAGLEIRDKVKIIENNDVTNRHILFASADIFVSPIDNIQETFGITPIEAMACGIPQIVSDWDGYKDTVVDGVTGFLIPTYWANCDGDIGFSARYPTNPLYRIMLHHFLLSQSVVIDLELYEKAVQSLIDNPELRHTMAENSVRIAKEKFSWQSVIKQYENLWEELYQLQKKSTEQLKKNMSFIQPIFCKAFSQYPSKFIDDSCIFVITSDGKSLFEGKLPNPGHYPYENMLLDYQLRPTVLEKLYLADSNGISMAEVVNSLKIQYSQDVIRRCLMGLAKHGIAKILQD